MRVTMNWLRDYVDIDETPERLAEALIFSGTNVEEVERHGDEDVLDLEITTNRPDCLGVIGVAREAAAVMGRPLRVPDPDIVESGVPVADVMSIEIEDLELCPRYTVRIVRGVEVGPSPEWLRNRLEAVGIRSVNNVVDVSNFVMMEWCQPLHFFDLARLTGNRVIVRRARPGESITAIDESKHQLTADRLVIADERGPIAIAGVMGGLSSEVSATTTDILIEAARFDPMSVRRTAHDLALNSESSFRFERFVDHQCVDRVSLRAAALLAEIAGGEIAPGIVDVAAPAPARDPVRLRWAQIPRLLGTEIARDRGLAFLDALGLAIVEQDEASVTVEPPSWRSDLTREADIIEEIARLHGFDSVPGETRMSVRILEDNAAERTFETARAFLVGAGLREVLTLGLVGTDLRQDPPLWTDAEAMAVRNPIRAGEDRLRRSLLGSLLAIADLNRDRGREGIRMFEIASIYLPRAEAQPEERTVASILVEDDLAGVKGLVESLLTSLGILGVPCVEPDDGSGLFRPGHGARVLVDDRVVARLGELHPDLAHGEGAALALAEVDLEGFIVEERKDGVRMVRPSRYPEVRRDVSVIVPEEITWERLRTTVDEARSPDLVDVRFFDLYRGKQVGERKKSVAFKLVYRSDERTLTGAEVDGRVAKIVEVLAGETGAVLRS
jgi:phenylalanyl-tRNA synthetase beta chain